jgi:hypothetical protein
VVRHTGSTRSTVPGLRVFRRALIALTILVAVVALGMAVPAQPRAEGPPTLSYACEPPSPADAANCGVWHTSPVTLQWIFDPSMQPVPGSDCLSPRVIDTDTAGADITCTVTAGDGRDVTSTATVRVDMTAPDVSAVPDRPPDREGWWNHPVTFAFGGSDATSGIASCDTVPFAGPDSATAQVTGGCSDVAGNAGAASVPVQYDATPPAVTGALPDRPPDHDGWWNHPVAFAFSGSDATSGIADCDTVVFSGPDADEGQVTGSCRDVAGNAAAGSVPVKYDATPPTVFLAQVDSGDGQVTITWSVSPDTLQSIVKRSPGRDGDPSTTVYSGPSQTFTDYTVAGGITYTYTIVAVDAAANPASAVVIVTPGASRETTVFRSTDTSPYVAGSLAGASRPAKIKSPRRLTLPRLRWPRVRDADYYNVQVFRAGRKILSAWPKGAHMRLHQRWTFKGRTYRLTPGRYTWYAWPGFGSRRAHVYGRMILRKRFTIPALA